jgi:hypothetical protein
MALKPVEKMLEAVEIARTDSDVSLFFELLYLGELLTKTVAAGLVAAIVDDRDRHRYRQLHRLVRADGLGEWIAVIDDVLAGPAAQFLTPRARSLQRELTELLGPGSWQYEVARLLHSCLKAVDATTEPLPARIDGRRSLAFFVTLRNKTRGHGATQGETCGRLCGPLEKALRFLIDSLGILKLEWVYLYRNLSGKYRVTRLGDKSESFDYLKRATTESLPNGLYVFLDGPTRVDLMESTVDAVDFLYPNGGFSGKRYELISYATDSKSYADAGPYLAPATELPPSETEGVGSLEDQGQVFGNLPPETEAYIERRALEADLYDALMDDRHPIITLAGRGGIGKTSLSLRVLHRVAQQRRFSVILWFSSRDIDLLPEGPKLVRPQVISRDDIAAGFADLLQPTERRERGFRPVHYLQESLRESPVGPILFVIDNFETVRAPGDVFAWLDTYIRNPNKILITTRQREFKADFPVEVLGMTEDECDALIDVNARTLGILDLIMRPYRDELFREADGHPYVIKILLGEVAKAGRPVKVDRIVATKEGILEALFERTYAGLSPIARRVFLTLCNWQSTVPKLAVEAVLLRADTERLDVDAALDELRRSSFIEARVSERDGEIFLTVPLVSALFGRRKLAVSELKSGVDADTEILHLFGAAQPTDIRHGVEPRIHRLFRYVARRVSGNPDELTNYRAMLEFIATKYPPAWLLLADLYEESGIVDASLEHSKQAVRRYLEAVPADETQRPAWVRLADLCARTGDWLGEIHAVVEAATLPGAPFRVVSAAANRLNGIFRRRGGSFDTYEKQALVRRLVEVMERRLDEADATDCSRLGWLALHLGDTDRAARFASRGLALDGDEVHCVRLGRRLGVL